MLTLSFCGGGWVGVQSHFMVKPNLVLRLGWRFDNIIITRISQEPDLRPVFKFNLVCFGTVEK